MDIFTLDGLIKEISPQIKNCRINKIFQSDEHIIEFKLSNKKNLIFNIDPRNSYFFLTNKTLAHPKNPTSFVMFLRKYILNAKVLNFYLNNFYRECTLEILKKEKFFLIINLTGKRSNIILKNKKGEILINLNKFFENNIEKNVKILSNNELIEKLKKNEKIDGLPPFVSKYLKMFLKNNNISDVYNVYLNLLNFNISYTPYLLDNKVYPFLILNNNDKLDFQKFDTFSELFEYKFFESSLEKQKKELIMKLTKELKKQNKILEKIILEIQDKNKFEELLQYGELLKANIYKIKKGIKEIEVDNFFNNMNKLIIPLKEDLSPVENIEYYFKRAKKFKRGLLSLKKRKQEIESKITFFEDLIYFVENVKDIEELNSIKNECFPERVDNRILKSQGKLISPKYEIHVKDNIKIFVGKSAKANDFILKKFGSPDFIWMHAKDYPGAHIIIAENEDKIPQNVFHFGSELALLNSKAKYSKKGEVVYTKVKYIKKPKGSPPGMVILEKFKTIMIKL